MTLTKPKYSDYGLTEEEAERKGQQFQKFKKHELKGFGVILLILTIVFFFFGSKDLTVFSFLTALVVSLTLVFFMIVLYDDGIDGILKSIMFRKYYGYHLALERYESDLKIYTKNIKDEKKTEENTIQEKTEKPKHKISIMNTFKNFEVKSFRLYSDIYIYGKDNIRYHKIFNYPTSQCFFSELVIINRQYKKSVWDLTLDLEISVFQNDDGKDDPGDFIKSKTLNRKIEKNEFEIKIVQEHNYKGLIETIQVSKDFCAVYYLKNKIAARTEFTIQCYDRISEIYNPYFHNSHFYLYRENSNGVQTVFNSEKDDHKIFFKAVLSKRFSNLEKEDFECELFFILRDKNMEKVFEIQKNVIFKGKFGLQTVDIEITSETGELKKGKYTIEMIHLGFRRGFIEFEIADYDEIRYSGDKKSHRVVQMRADRAAEETTAYGELKNLTGLEGVKNEIEKIKTYVNYQKSTNSSTDTKKLKLHMLFKGNPGTGKTMIAMRLGEIFKNFGVLSKGNVTVVGRNHLIGGYIGQTAMKTAEVIEKARGGILFIDEAYSLYRPSTDNDYGFESLEVIIKEMSDGPGDLIIVAAGYPNSMDTFLRANQGLASRFKFTIDFPDFTPKELLKIAKKRASKKGLLIGKEALDYLTEKVKKAYRDRTEAFGNARFINNIIDKAQFNLSSRFTANPQGQIELFDIPLRLEVEDFKGLFDDEKNEEEEKKKTEIDGKLFKESMKELLSLTGIDEIKKDVKELVLLLKYYREEGMDYVNNISLHSVFKGNPGTGKTTVARILAKFYKSLGVLEKGQLVECDRAGLVAGYIGQTALKTERMIEMAMGGVLFIDEAYSLSTGDEKDFGYEAIQTLLKKMSDCRGKFAMICAGYSDEMDTFLNSNPGLKSRFDKIYEFKDYSENELLEIADYMLYSSDLDASEVEDELADLIRKVCEGRDKSFGNAREMKKLTERIANRHYLRLAEIDKNDRTDEMKKILIPEDLDVDILRSNKSKPTMGFKIYEDDSK